MLQVLQTVIEQLMCVEDSKITFCGDCLIQNVILILEIGQGSLKPSNDSLLKDDLVAFEPASCPT